ncbi:MAG TPA: tyrosine/phenylalanine carboxypeptidase domain-containing protein [Mariniphaga sp.]|nr:tyrosine/phenylalanine carboxypeptidase domain-containing protein [Mariniphaga sp.]
MVYDTNNNPHQIIEKELNENEGLHIDLGVDGMLHIERKLPFLIVYRPVGVDEKDIVIENILKNEASYLIIAREAFPNYKSLLKKLIKKFSDEFGAFLILEIWLGEKKYTPFVDSAGFNLYGPSELPETMVRFKSHLEEMSLAGLKPDVTIHHSETRNPAGSETLVERKVLKQLECLLLGLEIEPFYRDISIGSIYPLLERRLYSSFSLAFKKTVFDFVKVQTKPLFTGFQSLARREIMPEVWDIDRQLVEIDSRIKFLMLISPVNGIKAWKAFRNSGYKKAPVFHYRMIPDDPELLKRTLYNIKIEGIDDPTLNFLFREKRAETDKMLSMLMERESTDFFYGSLQLFGSVSNQLLAHAKEILKEIALADDEKKGNGDYYNAQEFAELSKQELRFLQQQWPGIDNKVVIKDTIDSMMVDKGIFYIPQKTKVLKQRAEAMIQHEIGTHVVTYYNGRNQPLKLLSSGIPGYEELQEGIAVLAEYLSGGLGAERMKVLAGRVVAVDSLINHRNFIKTFEVLTDEYRFNPRSAFFIATRVYRGGGFTKDAIYLRGFLSVLKYLKDGNSLEPLLIGKIRQSHIPVIEELISRKILKPLSIKPRYLFEPAALVKLEELKKKNKVSELINFTI